MGRGLRGEMVKSGALTLLSPAKINLFLAITGRRTDGYHNLISIAAPLDFGDSMRFEATDASDDIELVCTDPSLAVDESNLVIKAARAFREASGWTRGAKIHLEKKIPLGAGLGGGSSNATTTLMALNELAGTPLAKERLSELAARLGSDCALFLEKRPILMQGRGERVELLPVAAVSRLSGTEIVLIKPTFGIATAWAYRQMALSEGRMYVAGTQAREKVEAWVADQEAPLRRLLFNNMEMAAFSKYLALPALLNDLRKRGMAALMSGSGSACFVLVEGAEQRKTLEGIVKSAWGNDCFIQSARIV